MSFKYDYFTIIEKRSKHYSEACSDFLRKILKKSQKERFSAKLALTHHWFIEWDCKNEYTQYLAQKIE